MVQAPGELLGRHHAWPHRHHRGHRLLNVTPTGRDRSAQPEFLPHDLRDLPALVDELQDPNDFVSQYVSEQLRDVTRTNLARLAVSQRARNGATLTNLLTDLNNVLNAHVIYDTNRFAGIFLRAETRRLSAEAASLRDLLDGLARTAPASPGLKPKPSTRPPAQTGVRPPAKAPAANTAAASPTGGPIQPAAGTRVRRFGQTVNGVRHEGLTLATRSGAQVIAPMDARVQYAGVFRTYGLPQVVAAFRNIDGIDFEMASDLNADHVVRAEQIVMDRRAFDHVVERVSKVEHA